MKALFTLLSVALTSMMFISSVHAQDFLGEGGSLLVPDEPYEAPKGRLFNEDAYFRGQTWLSQYVNVIVINAGPQAQTLRLYTNRQLRLSTRVSTGLETFEKVGPIRGIIRRIGGKGTTTSHWRHTTRGFYSIKRVENEDYRSGESNYRMPFAMFFNERRGLAIHQVPPDIKGGEAAGEAQLGQRASSGCVRVHKGVVQDIHSAVLAADRGLIPVLDTRTGNPKLDDSGKVVYDRGYRSLVIIEDY